MAYEKAFLTIVVTVVVVFGVLMAAFFLNNGLYKWKTLKEIKQCESIFNFPIKKITLRKSITSSEWAVFDDEDLILLWADC